jgi:hypothetical protein
MRDLSTRAIHSRAFHGQRGIGIIPLLIIAAVLVVFGTVGLRLFPIYQEFMTVNSILKDVAAEGAANRSMREIWGAASRRFQINSVDSVRQDHLKVEQRGEGRVLLLNYEVRTNMIANVDAVVRFDKEYPLGP